MSGPSKKSSPFSDKPEDVLVYVERLRQQAEEFQRTVQEDLRLTSAQLFEERVVRLKGGVMQDEWSRVISGDRLVKFTYYDLPSGEAFMTAQIAAHEVVYRYFQNRQNNPSVA